MQGKSVEAYAELLSEQAECLNELKCFDRMLQVAGELLGIENMDEQPEPHMIQGVALVEKGKLELSLLNLDKGIEKLEEARKLFKKQRRPEEKI